MTPATIAVLGGGYAGILAARRAAAALGPLGRVTLYADRDYFVERIRLHQVAAGQVVRTIPLPRLLGRAGFEVARVVAIDPAARAVITDRGRRTPDFVIHALGSRTARAIPGAVHALALDDPDGAAAVAAAAGRAVAAGRPLAIVGGGLTAIELAAELAEAHPALRLMLITRGALGDGALGPAAVAHARAALARRSVEVLEGQGVTAIAPDAVEVDGARIAVAATVLCAGFAASPLAAAADLAVDRLGRMLLTPTLSVAGAGWLWGAGDAAVPAASVGAPVAMACKTALPMAACAADNVIAAVTGAAPTPFRFGDSGVCVSLGRRDAVIQQRAAGGANRGVTRGRLGAWVKEGVCRFTVLALRRPASQRVYRIYARRGAAALAASTDLALPAAP
jgi:NADH dehydrogenase